MGLRPHPVWSPVGAVGARLLRPGKPEYQAGNTTLNFPSLPVGQRLCSLRPARFVRWHGLEHRGFRKLTQPPLHTKLSGRITDIGQLITSPGSLYPTAIHNHRAALNRVEQGQYLIARRATAARNIAPTLSAAGVALRDIKDSVLLAANLYVVSRAPKSLVVRRKTALNALNVAGLVAALKSRGTAGASLSTVYAEYPAACADVHSLGRETVYVEKFWVWHASVAPPPSVRAV